MAQIKIEAVINVDDFCDFNDIEQLDWFIHTMNDKKETFLQLWSNDFGDEIGSTYDFKWELINK